MPSQAYYESDGVGDWYEAIADTAPGESPVTHPELWRKIEIPQFMERCLVSAALAHLHRGDGQSDKSLAERRVLADEMELLVLQHADFQLAARPLVFTR